MEVMDGTFAPVGSPVTPRGQGLTLLQTVRGRYLSLQFDVPTLLMAYVRLLDQLGSMSQQVKTCKLQCRMLYEGHSMLYASLKNLRKDSTAESEMRFAGGLELAWHALKPLHTAITEWVELDEMEFWFRHTIIQDQIALHWKTLDEAILEMRTELGGELHSFVALRDTSSRVLVVPGSSDIARRQVQRVDQLELPKLFRGLVSELESWSSLTFMKHVYIEEFMAAIQRVGVGCFVVRVPRDTNTSHF
ncbi:uncharacterized protein EI90DRAFT_2645264 [Cantharellus anzutake]|uniref:uncharacterized protein n=1 Tax=Cantharellus anzutake TaxID=1750568 RepID=UPI0019086291|nr:uncharacterized protein EI90DRAFT_2645264 [Cantharellus anzutake]KAF8337388.1 hypothetical protein EI90DRAFT_2645264 [Cantharellus anzutake]